MYETRDDDEGLRRDRHLEALALGNFPARSARDASAVNKKTFHCEACARETDTRQKKALPRRLSYVVRRRTSYGGDEEEASRGFLAVAPSDSRDSGRATKNS